MKFTPKISGSRLWSESADIRPTVYMAMLQHFLLENVKTCLQFCVFVDRETEQYGYDTRANVAGIITGKFGIFCYQRTR